jgi:lipoprotein-releasing system ATP-binding protein
VSAVLQTRSLVRTLGTTVKNDVLKGLDLEIERGEFVALTGHSGSGKSTLLYLLGALDRPTSGQVVVDGVDATTLDDDGRSHLRNRKLGFVFQFHFLLPEFTAAENVMIPLLRRGLSESDARARATRSLGDVDLGGLDARKPGQLSGGQQQRVAIARALAGDPAILLADEPTGNLDSVNGGIVFDLFERQNESKGMTIVMVTHDRGFAERASRQIVLKDGRIVDDVRR